MGTQPLNYQWYVKPTADIDFTGMTALSDGGQITGATSNVLTVANLASANATNYFVIASNSAGAVTSSVVTLTVSYSASLAFWNFNGVLIVTNPLVTAGGGVASYINCSAFSNGVFASALDYGGGSPNNSWGTDTYPTNGNLANNKTAGVRFKASTLGAKNIIVSYDTRATAASSKYERLQYSTNGTDFIDYPASSSFSQAGNFESRSFSLVGFPGVPNNTNFTVRIVSEFESTAKYGASTNTQYVGITSAYGTSGTLSYDVVNISGDAITNANTLPTITSFTNVITTDTNSPVVLNFTVGDTETLAGDLNVSVTSSNQAVMPDGKMSLGGSGASRTLTLDPFANAVGVAPILVSVTDGNGDVTTTWFYVTVNPGNQAPTISGLVNTNMLGNITNTFPFTVGDDATAANSLTVTAFSGNTTLVSNLPSCLSVGGSGANRTLIVAPVTNQYGVTPITVTVNDGYKDSTATIYVVVRPNTVTAAAEGFDYDTAGALITQSAGYWQSHSGTVGQMQVGSGVVTVTDAGSEDVNVPLLGQPYTSANVDTLYCSFTLNFSDLPTATNAYFAHFKDATSGGFYGRIYATTATAASGAYRIGIGNTSAANSPAQFPMDLTPGVNYTVVTRLSLTNGFCTIWVNPVTEASTSTTDTTVVGAPSPIVSYALRQAGGEGTMKIDNLRVGPNFLTVTTNVIDVPPLANPDTYTVTENSKTNALTPLGNDVLNLSVGALTVYSVSATNGTATITSDRQQVRYTPASSFSGTSTIGYTITDGFGGLSSSTITVTVTPLTPEPIGFQTTSGKLILTWTQPGFFLQTSTNVAGPYITVPGATSPFTNVIGTNAAQFYRLSD